MTGKGATCRPVNKHDSSGIAKALPRPARERGRSAFPRKPSTPAAYGLPTSCRALRAGDPDCRDCRRARGGNGWRPGPGRGRKCAGYLRSQCLVHSPLAMGSSWTFYFTSLLHNARVKQNGTALRVGDRVLEWPRGSGATPREGDSPPPRPSRGRAGPGPSPGGSRGSCSPGPGGHAEEPRGRRWRGRAGGSGLRVGPPVSPRLRAPHGPGPPRLLLLRPSRRGFQRRGLHTAPPAAREEKAKDVQEVER